MFEKKSSLVGVDIGSHAIKMICLKEKNGVLSLLNVGILPVIHSGPNETKASRQDRIAKSIQKLASHLKVKNKLIALSLSGYEVMTKKIELPTMTEEELEDRMHLELGQYIPYNIDEVEVDYQILDAVRDRPNFMDVLLVAAKKESINDYIELGRAAGFEPTVIDVDFFALSNAFESSYGLVGKENVLLVDIGASKAAMNALNHGLPIFTRDLPIGGEQINQAIQDNFGVTREDSERIKLGEITAKIGVKAVRDVVAGVVGGWLSEFKRAIDFYYRNYPENSLEKIFLSGGASRLSGLAAALQDYVGIPAEIFNPLSKIDCDPAVFDSSYIEYVGPQMAISFGLALRKTSEK